MSDQAVLLPKSSPHGRIILAKEQLDHSNMPIMIFSRVYFFLAHPFATLFGAHNITSVLKKINQEGERD